MQANLLSYHHIYATIFNFYIFAVQWTLKIINKEHFSTRQNITTALQIIYVTKNTLL